MDRMKITSHLLKILVLVSVFIAAPQQVFAASQVLATIGSLQVSSDDLNAAMASSPFATQMTSMNENDQASLRGDMLRRLVAARLLTLEAQKLGLDKTPAYQKEMENFRLGLLYRFYMDKLRERIVIPADTLAAMKKQFKGDAEGLTAAKAGYINGQYQTLKLATLQDMLKRDRTELYEDRIKPGIKADTVLMEGNSFRITYGDIVDIGEHPTLPNPEWVKEQLYNRGEMLLAAKAAEKEGVDISGKLAQYEAERLPSVMLDAKTGEWIPDEKTLQAWFDKHPEVAHIPERRHVGQLVVATRQEAEALRARIVKGESLFTLAGKFSIDPVGRKQNGDMGWIVAGRGMPELDKTLAGLEDNKISEVVETKMGFHLLTILEHQSGGQKTFAEVRDRVRQMIINEKLPPYLGELERNYQVSWKVIKARNEEVPQQTGK
ncbi:MAG: peptidyl-prolyl cis-trans isomerase [Gammaproteobacteria bacterium]|nr:peptidyl-prolyl cis-trans isomerase [Gammaproteobacteria bacterium]MBU1481587.1 peptidyl-prolyl cis-trans isomerase [Gammaproteobacteria bacterium]